MSTENDVSAKESFWVVGTKFGGKDDQLERFLQEGIWECGTDKHANKVRSIQVGERIAAKSGYNTKKDLPFDNRGQDASVMEFKAIGTVTQNLGNSRRIRVDWQRVSPSRKWYFFTCMQTIWRIPRDPEWRHAWLADALYRFAFNGEEQDIDRFRHKPYWRGRFGDSVDPRVAWTAFYEELADKLLTYRNRRGELLAGIYEFSLKVAGLSKSLLEDGEGNPLRDICPFTVMSLFNRQIADENRKAIATELAHFLGVSIPAPDSFVGIPFVANPRQWFRWKGKKYQSDNIELLWDVYAQAFNMESADNTDARESLSKAFDAAMQLEGVGKNLTIGLHWIRPWRFVALSTPCVDYIIGTLGEQVGKRGAKSIFVGKKSAKNADEYFALIDTLNEHFQDKNCPVFSFPELSLVAWEEWSRKGMPSDAQEEEEEPDLDVDETQDKPQADADTSLAKFTLDDILSDGCFLPREKLESILKRLQSKKNLILQGPPGTGKTWLAKRLAYALLGERNDKKVRAVQFHPNLSYEDFVRGYRPSADGKLALVDGFFMGMIAFAKEDPDNSYVVIIEEINRGNPAQVFGEMLTLLEASKRRPEYALELSYKCVDEAPTFIPPNLYVIGTMNIADRSLALVDLALRRRFAFVDLEPTLGLAWRSWCEKECGMAMEVLQEIEKRIHALNDDIRNDRELGAQYRVGHSYVTPSKHSDAREWFCEVVETEIGPLLDEYWFSSPDKAKKAKERLLEGLSL